MYLCYVLETTEVHARQANKLFSFIQIKWQNNLSERGKKIKQMYLSLLAHEIKTIK